MKYTFTQHILRFTLNLMAVVSLLSICFISHAQINVTGSQTAATLAQALTGTGVVVLNASTTCPAIANGTFSNGFSPLGIDSGIILTSGRAATLGANVGVNVTIGATAFATTANNAPGDAQLNAISNTTTNDACVLEFDFVPAGDTIKFQYVFGSEEYPAFNCSFNDVFGFLISGPGITGYRNIATIPNTNNIPVAISTINDSTNVSGPCLTNTLGHGPYVQYYITNTSNYLSYNGYTQPLTAVTNVIPCDTYHLKLAIADAGDFAYDSGVFLKAGSLNSTGISITPVGTNGLANANTPYCVRNCAPGKFVFGRTVPTPNPLTIHYLIQGTAVNGSDYTFIPDSIVIPANSSSATRFIYALAPPLGTKQIVIKVLAPYLCNNNQVIVDSAKLTIVDSIKVNILNNDTTFCIGGSDALHLEIFPGDTILTYSWSPATGLNNPNIKNPIATPTVTTTYTVSALLPGSGCPAAHDQVVITVRQPPVVNAGPDTTTCVGTPFTFNTTATPASQNYTYSWTPGTYLSNANVQNPTFTATTEIPFTTYIVTADVGAGSGCLGYDTVRVRVLPGDFTLGSHDTAICKGASVYIGAAGDPNFSYQWTPTPQVSNPFILAPVITPDTTRTYTVKASFPGCPIMQHSLVIDVQPNPQVFLGGDRAKCQWDTLDLQSNVVPDWYQHYSYSWAPSADLDHSNTQNVVFGGQASAQITLTVTTPAGCSGQDDIFLTVHQGNFASMTPVADTAICPNDSIQLSAAGGVTYEWVPDQYLTNAHIANPVSHPYGSINYTGFVTDQYGCFDTLSLAVTVNPEALVNVPDSITIFPGESYQMDPQGNCLYFTWFPPDGLSNPNIANPVASPQVNTRYYITASTESGCTAVDSIVIIADPETDINVPNAFAPGGGTNGEIRVVHRGFASLKYFRIFNRWGTKVFETSDLNQGWDGRFNGAPQPMGVYVYYVEAITASGKHFAKQGNITLIR